MDDRDVGTVVIGGSQSNRAVGYYLTRRGLPFVILDEHDRIGDAWRKRWDSLRLFTSGHYDGLPGMPFPGSPSAYPTKDETADYLEAYAREFELHSSRRSSRHSFDTCGGKVLSSHPTQRDSTRRVGYPVLENGSVLDVSNVIWCTGYRPITTGSTSRCEPTMASPFTIGGSSRLARSLLRRAPFLLLAELGAVGRCGTRRQVHVEHIVSTRLRKIR